MKIGRFLASLIVIGLMSGACRAQEFGIFLDELKTKWLDNGRDMELLADFRFQAPDQNIWTAKKDAKVDGASIPQAFWSLIGGPFEGLYRKASVIHDYYCEHHLKDWQSTHRIFYLGMRASGVPELKAKTMYYAVYAFGPRWGTTTVHGVRQICKDGRCIETLSTIMTTTKNLVEITDRQIQLVNAIQKRLDAGDALSLDDIDRVANEDRKSATALPAIIMDIKTLQDR